MKSKNLIPTILRNILLVLCLGSFILISYYIFKLDIIPNKYLIPGYIVSILLIVLSSIGLFKKTNLIIKIISTIVMLLMTIGMIIGINYLSTTYRFLNNTQVKYETLNYKVIVLKNSEYSDIKSLENKKILYLKDDYNNDLKKALKKEIKYNESIIEEPSKLYEFLKTYQTDALVLEESFMEVLDENIGDFADNIKIIYEFSIKVKAHNEKENNNTKKKTEIDKKQEEELKKIEEEKGKIEEPKKVDREKVYVIYVSGIDSYGGYGRSDVNQIMVINKNTNHILLANTPRDYYVSLIGKGGVKDKLTHAGLYGVGVSIATLERLYNIDINYYIKINFSSVVKLVDLIGGVDIYNNYAFNSYHIKGWYVRKGNLHLDGRHALAYARERYNVPGGDRGRGELQQKVITAIINKISKSSTLLNKYNNILNSLSGTFTTDIPTELMTSFVKYQLDKMPTWKVSTVSANGYDSMNVTYSAGTAYVMEPDWNSVYNVKSRIYGILGE